MREQFGWQVLLGVVAGFVLLVVQFPIWLVIGTVACGIASGQAQDICGMGLIGALLFPGAVQLLYIVPAVIVAFITGWRGVGVGIIIAASIIALLNASCWGLLLTLTGFSF